MRKRVNRAVAHFFDKKVFDVINSTGFWDIHETINAKMNGKRGFNKYFVPRKIIAIITV